MSGTFQKAVKRIAGKTPVASRLNSAQWEDVPLAIRERAFFSACLDDVRILQTMQGKLNEWANWESTDKPFMSKTQFRTEMKEFLSGLGLKTGGKDLQELGSDRRLNLIYDFQTQDAANFGRWQNDQDEDMLDLYPCQELLRIENRKEKRDWRNTWLENGGRFFGGRMIAKKSDKIWVKISRFGRPWPPFDFGSGMGLEDVDRDEAEDLGVIHVGEVVPPQTEDFNQSMEASIASLDDEMKALLARTLGEDVVLGNGKAKRKTDKGLRKTEEKEKISTKKLKKSPTNELTKPVSDALEVKVHRLEHRKAVKEGIQAIDNVHDDGVLPKCPVGGSTRSAAEWGAFRRLRYKELDSQGNYISTFNEIGLRNNPATSRTTVHEIGHFIDFNAWGTKGYGSENHPDFSAWRDAVKASKAYKKIESEYKKAKSRQLSGFLDYLLSPRECWARCYEQFITKRSGSHSLKLAEEYNRKKSPYNVWDDKDFEPIEAEMEKIFKKKGWM